VHTKKQRREQVIALLEKVSFEAEHFDRYPHEFSGASVSRIVIARACLASILSRLR